MSVIPAYISAALTQFLVSASSTSLTTDFPCVSYVPVHAELVCDCLLQVLFGHCSAALRNPDTSRKPHCPLLRDIVSVAQIVSSVLMPGWTVRLGTVPGASVLSLLYFPVPPQRLFLELASARYSNCCHRGTGTEYCPVYRAVPPFFS